MAVWAVSIPAEQWATERLFHNETVTVAGAAAARPAVAGVAAGARTVAPDEEVLLVADDHVVALARAAKADGDDLVLTYLRRAFDNPQPAAGLIDGLASTGPGGGPALTGAGGGPALAGAGGGSALAGAGGGPALTRAGGGAVEARAGGGAVEVEPQVFRRLAAALGAEPGPGTPTWLVSLALPIEAATPADAVRQFWTHVVELGPRELPAYVWPSGDELAMQAFVLGEEANQDPEEDDED